MLVRSQEMQMLSSIRIVGYNLQPFDQQISAVSGAVTIAGSPAAGEITYFQLFRDANAGEDTFTGDARVLGIRIFFTTDAANDA